MCEVCEVAQGAPVQDAPPLVPVLCAFLLWAQDAIEWECWADYVANCTPESVLEDAEGLRSLGEAE